MRVSPRWRALTRRVRRSIWGSLRAARRRKCASRFSRRARCARTLSWKARWSPCAGIAEFFRYALPLEGSRIKGAGKSWRHYTRRFRRCARSRCSSRRGRTSYPSAGYYDTAAFESLRQRRHSPREHARAAQRLDASGGSSTAARRERRSDGSNDAAAPPTDEDRTQIIEGAAKGVPLWSP